MKPSSFSLSNRRALLDLIDIFFFQITKPNMTSLSATASKTSPGLKNCRQSLKQDTSFVVSTSGILFLVHQLWRTSIKQSITVEKQLRFSLQILWIVNGAPTSFRKRWLEFVHTRLYRLCTEVVRFLSFCRIGRILTGRIVTWNLIFGSSLKSR